MNHHQPWSIVPLMARPVQTASPKYVNGTRKSPCHNRITQVRINRQRRTASAYSPPIFNVLLSIGLIKRTGSWRNPGLPSSTSQFHNHARAGKSPSLMRSNCKMYLPVDGIGTSASNPIVSLGSNNTDKYGASVRRAIIRSRRYERLSLNSIHRY